MDNNLLFIDTIRNSGFLIWNVASCRWIKRHCQLGMPTIPLSSLYVMIMYLYMLFDHVFYVQYKKPPIIIELEKTLKEVYSKAKATKDGDVDCSPS